MSALPPKADIRPLHICARVTLTSRISSASARRAVSGLKGAFAPHVSSELESEPCLSRTEQGISAIGLHQAWPAPLTRCDGSIPILANARVYFDSTSGSKIRSMSAGQFNQPLAWISLSSWPGDHPA